MYSSFFVRRKNSLHCYYTNNNILYNRVYKNGRWNKDKVLQTGVKNLFNIDVKGKYIYIFIMTIKNSLLFLHSEDYDEYKSTVVFNNSEALGMSNNPYFYCVYDNSIFSIIYAYNIDRNKYNIAKITYEDDSWSELELIDTAVSNNKTPFYIERNEDKYIIVYNSQNGCNHINYREFDNGQFSDKVVIHSTNSTITNTSFISYGDSTYITFLSKNLFGTSIFFGEVCDGVVNNVSKIAESQKVRDLIIFIQNNTLYITFNNGNDSYYTYANNMEYIEFVKPIKLINSKKAYQSKKACIVNDEQYNQIFVDEYNPFIPSTITEINPNFMGDNNNIQEIIEKTKQGNKTNIYRQAEENIQHQQTVQYSGQYVNQSQNYGHEKDSYKNIEEQQIIKYKIKEKNLTEQITRLKTDNYTKSREAEYLKKILDENNIEY